MPSIMIDQSLCHIHTDNIRTIGELIPKLKEEFLEKGQILLSIQVDNKNFKPGSDEFLSNFDIADCEKINFKTQEKKSIAQETLDYLPEFLESLIAEINDCALEASTNKLYRIIEKVDIFVQLMSNIHKALNINSEHRLDMGYTIKELEVHLLFVIKAINTAFKKEDQIMLQDLLEYELIDNLTQWKIQALPKIKRLNSL
jgi:hypothetical protein